MDAKWPTIPKVESKFENAYSNPALIEQIGPELYSLVADHVELCKLLETLNGPMDMVQVTDTLELIDEELKTHFVAEEQVVFPLLANYLGGMEIGPIGVMMDEHRTIRSLYAETMDAYEATKREAEHLAEKLRNLSQALLNHLGKEDTGIFLMASTNLTDEEKAQVAAELPKYQK